MLAVLGGECAKSWMVVGLCFDLVLGGGGQFAISWRIRGEDCRLTAPYLEMCRTKSDASLNRGRGTMVVALASRRRRGWRLGARENTSEPLELRNAENKEIRERTIVVE